MSTTIQPPKPLSLVVALDDIRSHHNVGAIFRSADAFGVDELLLGGITPRPPHRDIHKSALGATESVSHSYHEHLIDAISRYKRNGFVIISIEQTENSTPLDVVTKNLQSNTVLILGNEVKGVSSVLLEISDFHLEIPQFGVKKSLNVSVCGGICMYLISSILRIFKE